MDIEENNTAWGEYMCIRVTLDVSKSLFRGKKLNVGIALPCWARFPMKDFSSFALVVVVWVIVLKSACYGRT